MKKNKKQLSIFKRIGLIAIALFTAIGSFFVPLQKPYLSQMASANDNVDTNYYFHSNDTYYIGVYNANYVATSSRFILFNGDIQYTVNNGVSFRFISYISVPYGLKIDYSMINSLVLDDKSLNAVYGSAETYFNVSYDTPYRLQCSIDDFTFVSYIYSQQDFNSNIYKVDLFLSDTNEWETTPRSDGLKFFNIKYYDIEDRYFCFSFLVSYDFYYNSRTYFFVNSSSLSDTQLYNQGYQQGLLDNQQSVYDNGFNAGKITGESIGYDKGVLESNDYSFSSLFGAVIDAPIKAFSGLLHFEILGINLLDFFLGLLTFGLIIFVIKLLLGGKLHG